MKKKLLFISIILLSASCQIWAQGNRNLSGLKVGRDEANQMRQQHNNEAFKISREDLMALANSSRAENDTFIFYLVKYTGKGNERNRHLLKGGNETAFSQIAGKKATSVLVGFIPGDKTGMQVTPKPTVTTVAVFDLARLCPPPPNCDCEIEQ